MPIKANLKAKNFQENTKSHEIKSIKMAIISISKREKTNKRAEEKKKKWQIVALRPNKLQCP
jgi:hypothetical protein